MKHTAGPWHKASLINGNVIIQGKDKHGHYYNIFEAPNTAHVSFGFEEMQANGRLAAHAPKLLETLQRIEKEATETPSILSEAALGIIILECREAIKQATEPA